MVCHSTTQIGSSATIVVMQYAISCYIGPLCRERDSMAQTHTKRTISKHFVTSLNPDSIGLLFSSTGHSLWLSGLFDTMLIVVPILWLERNWLSYVFGFEKSIELISTHWAFPLQLRAQYTELQPSLCGNTTSLRWRHNGRDCVSNHQPYNCLLNRLFGCRSK